MPPKPVIRKATLTPDLGEAMAVLPILCGMDGAGLAVVIAGRAA
jgi:hypothetical protein